MKKLRPALIEPLEPRLLLSADSPAALLDAGPALLAGTEAVTQQRAVIAQSAAVAAVQESRHEIAFVDAGIEEYQKLVADLRDRGGDGASIDVVVLDRDRDGVAQITEALDARARNGERFDAVHVFSHGTDAGIQLGSTWLGNDALATHAGLVADWGAALTADADLLLYGCNLANSAEGRHLVDSLAVLSGADVAASVDATGAAILGGDWDLEWATGAIESSVAVRAGAAASWAGLLDGTAISSVNGSPTPIAGNVTGTSFGAPGPTSNVGGPWEVIAGAEAPTRDEKIVVGIDGGGNLSGQLWNGSTWTPFAFNDVATGLDHEQWAFDVAYESASGDAVFVYGNGSSGSQPLTYRTWNGTSWSAPIAIATPVADEAERVRLAANPHSDELVLVATVKDKSDFALVWDGSSWGNAFVLPGGNSSKDFTDVSVAYEQQSGHAMVVYGTGGPLGGLLGGLLGGSTVGTAIWDGASWTTGAVSAPLLVSGEARWTSLASDPNSDRLALGVVTDNRYVWLSVWNGSNWSSTATATSNAANNDRLLVAVAFESQSGQALATYGVNDDNLHYRTWSAGGGWSTDRQGGSFAGKSEAMTLDADPRSDTIMLSMLMEDKRVVFRAWNGNAVVASGLQVADAGINKAQPFLFLWDQQTANRAPVLTPAAPALPAITEDDVASPGVFVSALLGASVSDPDTGAFEGIAITALASGNGTWEYSTDGGSLWNAVGPVTPTAALLLRDTDKIRFVPDGQNGTTASFTFRAWDQTAGSSGTKVDASIGGAFRPFSVATDTASIAVGDVNDAPILDTSGTMTLTNVIENDANPPGNSVASILLSAGGDRVTDVDLGALEGMAVVGVDDSNGTWEYSIDGGAIWTPFGAVSTASAVLLDANDRVRFVPTPAYGGPAGDITFHAWDQSSGASGDIGVDVSMRGQTTAFSLASETATLDVIPVNDAPDLNPMAPVLNPINEDDVANGGQTVASIVGASITDLDPGAFEGIAITGLASGNGSWEYSIDGGTSWSAVGGVADAAALLLRDIDRVRFVPDARNADNALFSYRAWDQTSGTAGTKTDVTDNGGTTPFSTLTDAASIAVSAVNDAPDLDGSVPMTLTDVTEDETNPPGDSVAAILASAGGDRITDVDFGALEGIAVVGADGSNGTWEYSIDGGGIWQGFGPVSDANAVLLDASALVRFVPAADYEGPAGDLEFRGWDLSAGSNGQTNVDASVNGTTTPFSVDTATATLSVTAANDAPVLAPSAPSLPAISEDDIANGGALVASLVGTVVDVDAGAVVGIAITGLASGNGSWEYSTDGGGSWSAIGPVSDASALLLRDSDWVRFVPDGQNATSASFTFRAWDQSSGSAEDRVDAASTGGTSAFSLASDTASITVTAVNDAPVLTPGAPSLPAIDEDETTNGGVSVASLLGGSVADVDTGAAEGIAITGLVSGNGSWEYSLDGGGSWVAVGSVDATAALLLRDTDRVRFVPDGQNATAASFTFLAWDQSSGSAEDRVDVSSAGGTSAFSLASDTASITVTAVNDAPVLTPSAPALPTITEDETANTGVLVSSLLGGSVADVDTGAAEGIAITALTSGNGTWEYSIDGGLSWIAVAPVSNASALLLRDTDSVRFVPNAQNATAASFTFVAWDQSVGIAGTTADTTTSGATSAFSLATDTASITVTAVNDAPVLAPTATLLPTITENDTANGGVLVSSLLGGVSDVDTGALRGIAITGVVAGNGSWEYSLDGGLSWNPVAPVSIASALLLRDTDFVRFVPDGQNGTAASLTFRAWDRTAGSAGTNADATLAGGTSAYSLATGTASITVTGLNTRPLLVPAGPSLPTITEDDTANPGVQVSTLVAGRVVDVDTGAFQGIAITGLASGNGRWEYSLDGGVSWIAVGPVSNTNALLLRDTDSVRFVPDAQNGTSASITYRAWDRTTGSAGARTDATSAGVTSAFSVAADTASILVTSVNDAPVLTPVAIALPSLAETDTNDAGVAVSVLLGGSVSDVDTGAIQGVAITGIANGNGTWEFSMDGGVTWSAIGSVSSANALLLRDVDRVRLVPDGANATTASLTYHAWDRTTGSAGANVDASAIGGTSAFSLASNTATISVTGVNDAPVLTPAAPVLPSITEDDTANGGVLVSSLLGTNVSDADLGALRGIAITALASGNGTWQYSTDGGGFWSAVGPVSNASALLLRDGDRVRFVPDAKNATAASFSYRAWDQSAGSAGVRADTTTAGGATAFSLATDTASITVTAVNDAPVLKPTAPALPAITEDDTANGGVLVSALVGSSSSDVDTGALHGIAVTALASGNGIWEYSTDGGASWTVIAAVSPSNALLLRDVDRVRFVPDAQNATTASIAYGAWDRSTGIAGTTADTTTAGGTSAFSLATDTASLTVTAVNDAPVLTPGAPALPTITEDEMTNGGVLVASLLGTRVTDVDTGALQGIAVTGLTGGNGVWQYSTDGGASWAAVGPVTPANALLLRDADRVRFVPDGRNGTAATIGFRAWDQSSGAGDAFSAASDTGSITVTAVNDAPVLGSASLAPVKTDATDPPGVSVADLFAGRFSDVDFGSFLAGVAVVGNADLASSQGTWQYSTDGGATWIAIGSVGDDATALVLDPAARLRFLPAPGFAGVPAGLDVRALDDSYAGAFTTTAGGVEGRALLDTSSSGGASAVAAATASIATRVDAETNVILDDADLAPILPPPPGLVDGPTIPTLVDDEEIASTPEIVPVELVPIDPDLFEPDEPVPTPPIVREFLAIDGPGAPRGDDAAPAAEVRAERRDPAPYTDGGALAALRQLVRTHFEFLEAGGEFSDALDRLRRDVENDTVLHQMAVGSGLALTAGLSVGYVIWLTRGGLLLASLTSSLPVWRLIDPIPILASLAKRSDEDEEDDESLDSLVDSDRSAEESRDRGRASRAKERSES